MFRPAVLVRSSVVASFVCGAVLAVGGQVVAAPQAFAEPPTSPSESAPSGSSVEEAVAEAVVLGDRVEATGERTETETVWAHPDGTVSREIATVPVRVEQDGQWVTPDYTLESVGDRLAPVASDVELSFADGGPGLAQLADEGQQFDVDWRGDLPAPTVAGPTATYADVLPGVDLVMTAVPGGYTEVLRVGSRAAAADPGLDRLRFPTEVTPGSEVSETRAGGLEVTDADGAVAFQAPAPLMWDSSGGRGAAAAGLGEGDRVATMDLAATGDQVVVAPDQRLLDDPGTVYPVYIDPTPAAPKNDWAMVQKEYPGTSFYRWDNNGGSGQGVGFQNETGVSTKRLIWEFDLGNVPNDATILEATMRVTEVHSWSCTKAPVNLDRVSRIGPNVTWNNQPSQVNAGNLASSSIQVRQGNGEGGDCKRNDYPIAFSNDEVATAVHNSLDENAIALRLSAAEGGPLGWKRFLNDAVLEVTYNRRPNQPTDLDLTGETGKTCTDWFPSGSAWALPQLSARFGDPDSGDTLDAMFHLFRETANGYVEKASPAAYNIGNGLRKDVNIPVGGVTNDDGDWIDGHYRFSANARDNHGGGTLGPTSALCGFYLDSHRPTLADVTGLVTDPETDQTTPLDSEEWIPRGRQVEFSFDPTGSKGYDGVNDVDFYRVASDVPAFSKTVNPGALGAFGHLSFASTDPDLDPGEHWIRVTAYDRAGNPSGSLTRLFRIQGAQQVARYRFDTDPGPALPHEGLGQELTFSKNGASFTADQDGDADDPGDQVLTLDGVTGYASADRAAVSTAGAFSVSGWVRPTGSITGREVIASQRGGDQGSAFTLAVEPGCAGNGGACLTFTVTEDDGTSHTVSSPREIKPGQWYLVAGSYDSHSSPERLRAWVAQEVTSTGPGDPLLPLQDEQGRYQYSQSALPDPGISSQASTGLLIGAEGTGTSYTPGHFWRGDLEDLRLYSDEVDAVSLRIHLRADDPYAP